MPILIDLNAKTIQQIKGIPVSNGHGVFIDSFDGLIVYGSDGADKVGFFTYNPTTEEVKHVATTQGAPNFMHPFE
ncbi:MAG: hypothetical protein ACK5HT_13795 [Draconibacterium sp.]